MLGEEPLCAELSEEPRPSSCVESTAGRPDKVARRPGSGGGSALPLASSIEAAAGRSGGDASSVAKGDDGLFINSAGARWLGGGGRMSISDGARLGGAGRPSRPGDDGQAPTTSSPLRRPCLRTLASLSSLSERRRGNAGDGLTSAPSPGGRRVRGDLVPSAMAQKGNTTGQRRGLRRQGSGGSHPPRYIKRKTALKKKAPVTLQHKRRASGEPGPWGVGSPETTIDRLDLPESAAVRNTVEPPAQQGLSRSWTPGELRPSLHSPPCCLLALRPPSELWHHVPPLVLVDGGVGFVHGEAGCHGAQRTQPDGDAWRW
jgi:hypothetical protein